MNAGKCSSTNYYAFPSASAFKNTLWLRLKGDKPTEEAQGMEIPVLVQVSISLPLLTPVYNTQLMPSKEGAALALAPPSNLHPL